MVAMGLCDEVTRTAIAEMSHSTGIDNIDIGCLVEVALHKAGRAHLLANRLAISLIDLAAQRCDGEGGAFRWMFGHDLYYLLAPSVKCRCVSSFLYA